MTNSQRIADSVVLLIVARVSMVLALATIGLVAWLYSSWQDDKLDSIRDQIASAQGAAAQGVGAGVEDKRPPYRRRNQADPGISLVGPFPGGDVVAP